MPSGSRLTVRLSPALEEHLSARVRQGERVSDIVREALEAYLGLCQTERPTERPTPDTHTSDILSDMSARLSALASDMADIQQRLGQIEVQMAARAAPRPRPTPRPTPVSDTPPQEPPQGTFDPTKYVLGKLCPRGHAWGNTGQSLLRRTNRHCCACDREKFHERGKAQRQARRQAQRSQEVPA